MHTFCSPTSFIIRFGLRIILAAFHLSSHRWSTLNLSYFTPHYPSTCFYFVPPRCSISISRSIVLSLSLHPTHLSRSLSLSLSLSLARFCSACQCCFFIFKLTVILIKHRIKAIINFMIVKTYVTQTFIRLICP